MAIKGQHKLVISDEVWSAAAERAALEDKSLCEICEFFLSHYLDLPDERKPEAVFENASPAGQPRTVYMSKATWSQALGRKVLERRPVSAILEQQLRVYLGLDT